MNWYRKLIQEASFRNKVLAFSKRISTQLFNDIISMFENKKLNYGQIIIDQNQEKELRDFNVRKIVVEIRELNNDKNAIEIRGNFIEEQRISFIIISIDLIRFNKNNYEFFASELRNLMGHEIEHAENTFKKPSIPYSWIDLETSTLMDCINKTQQYLLNESEMNAYIREFMSRAKYNNSDVDKDIETFVFNTILKCNPSEISEQINQKTEIGINIEKIIKNTTEMYQKKIKQIYPNRGRYVK